jgi:hypothetical protein
MWPQAVQWHCILHHFLSSSAKTSRSSKTEISLFCPFCPFSQKWKSLTEIIFSVFWGCCLDPGGSYNNISFKTILSLQDLKSEYLRSCYWLNAGKLVTDHWFKFLSHLTAYFNCTLILYKCHKSTVRPKPQFWFRSDTETETQIGIYFWPIP